MHRPIDYTDLVTALVCRHGYTFAQVGDMTVAQLKVIADWREDVIDG